MACSTTISIWINSRTAAGMLGRLLSLWLDLAQDPQPSQGQAVQAPAQPPQGLTARTGVQQPNDISTSSPISSAIGSALDDFYRQTILQGAKNISGYASDAIRDPLYFLHAIGPSLGGLGPVASDLPGAVKGAVGAVRFLGPTVENATQAEKPSYGDLTKDEIERLQSVVNEAGRPLEVVGSAARGTRTAKSDIEYVVPPSSAPYYKGLQERLPGVDPAHGIVPGVGNPNIGPVVCFEPK